MFEYFAPGSFRLSANPVFESEALQMVGTLAERIPENLGALRPLGVILTGSFARGEGTIVSGHRGETHWLSDIECLVVFADESRQKKAAIHEALEKAVAELALELRDGSAAQVQLSPIAVSRLARMRPAIFTYELLEHGKLLWSEGSAIPSPKPAGPIPRQDGFRLLNNRIMEQLALRAGLREPTDDSLDVGYAMSKFWLDLGTSLSIFLDCYRPSYRERQSLIEAALASFDLVLPADVARTLLERFRAAMSVRLGSISAERMAWEGGFSDAARVAAEIWFWESAQILGTANDRKDWRSIPDRLRLLESTRQRARDWARLFLRTGMVRNVGIRGAGSLLRAGSFGNAIYVAGCLLEFFWDEIGSGSELDREIETELRGLFGVHSEPSMLRRELAERAFHAWQCHLRDAGL